MRAAAPYADETHRARWKRWSAGPSHIDHPLVREPPAPQRAAVLILTSDRGFAGGYNANVLREAQRLRAMLRRSTGMAVRHLRDRAQGHHLAPVPGPRAGR